MKIPPRWKVAREVRRFGPLVRDSPVDLVNYLFSTTYYDYVLAKRKSLIDGGLPERSKIVIFLIFPQYGVKPSHLRALDHFEKNGYATLIVSNAELSEDDRAKVLKRCWRLILRPNFGYDFGGYRDGILELRERLKKLDRLVLMNDSCWFPLSDQDNWLKKAETLGPSFVGATSHYGAPRVEPKDFHTMKWSYHSSAKSFHYASFALSIGSDVLQNRSFLRFWLKFRLSNDKARTVRRGEIGLTHWVLNRGYSHTSTLDVNYLDQELTALSPQRLREIAERLIFPDDIVSLEHKSDVLNINKELNSEKLIALILTGVANQGASYTLVEYAIKEKSYSFLKKSPIWLNKESSDMTLSVIQDLSEPTRSELKNEALELRAKKAKF